jgi:hypothetical protein
VWPGTGLVGTQVIAIKGIDVRKDVALGRNAHAGNIPGKPLCRCRRSGFTLIELLVVPPTHQPNLEETLQKLMALRLR